jgi:phosphopantothenate---cysteine ligase (ATP)
VNDDHQANQEQLLLKVHFTSVSEYLFMLKEISMLLAPLGPLALLYLAAAVSDFFIPQDKMVESID